MHNRNYYLDGKKIATNRHKAKDQKTKSLEEVRPGLTKEQLSKLTVQEHPKQYKNRNRIMPGAVMQYTQKLTKKQIASGINPVTVKFVMDQSDGKHDNLPDYYVTPDGKKYRAGSCTLVAHNTGLVFV